VPEELASPVRVVIVDDHDFYRDGLRELLEEAGIAVLGDAASAEEALDLVPEVEPDVVIMDLGLPGMSGTQATSRLREIAPSAQVLVLTISADDRDVSQAIVAGACGYLLKDASVAEIVAGVKAAATGESSLSPHVAARLIEDVRSREAMTVDGAPELSPRELEVLRLLVQGMDNADIAQELVISVPTVKHHVASILEKLPVQNRIQAAVYAVRAGLI
jgi:two-component system, NarL family, response regulator LiaR